MKISDLRNDDPTIYVLVGLPASGKSTWVKEKIKNSQYSFDIISSDDIIERIAEEKGLTMDEVFFEHVGEATKQVWVDLNESIECNKNIIFDQTNLTEVRRAKILAQVPDNYTKVVVVLKVDVEQLHERLNIRAKEIGKSIPQSVIERMSGEYQEPTKDEGFDLIIHK